jgi:hypothetical protein
MTITKGFGARELRRILNENVTSGLKNGRFFPGSAFWMPEKVKMPSFQAETKN